MGPLVATDILFFCGVFFKPFLLKRSGVGLAITNIRYLFCFLLLPVFSHWMTVCTSTTTMITNDDLCCCTSGPIMMNYCLVEPTSKQTHCCFRESKSSQLDSIQRRQHETCVGRRDIAVTSSRRENQEKTWSVFRPPSIAVSRSLPLSLSLSPSFFLHLSFCLSLLPVSGHHRIPARPECMK